MKNPIKSIATNLFIERPAQKLSLNQFAEKLDLEGGKLARSFAAAEDSDGNRATLRHITGIERWGQKAGEIAEIFQRRADYVSWWAKRARELRLSNLDWAQRYETLDESLRRRYSGAGT